MQLLASILCVLAFGQSPEDYRLGPGDVVDVKVHGHDFGRNNFVLGASGDISFPYVGKVALAELTVFEAEETMKAALADGYLVDPEVTVQVAEHRSQRVEVLGAVANAGLYYLEGPTTVRQLIAKAGGLKQEQGGLVLVTRADQTTRIGAVDLEGPRGGMTLMAGDVVTVDSGGSVVYLAGEVSKPGPVQFSEGMTLSEALIRAGGSSNLGRLAGTYILRGEEKIVVNLKRVLKGKDADFVLKPGDRVVIPESPI